MRKHIRIILITTAFIVITSLSIVFNLLGQPNARVETNTTREFASLSDTSNDYIVVYLSGEINNPGVYKVDKDTRLYQVITQAGGLTMHANKHAINLAQTLSDELHINIPKRLSQNVGEDIPETDDKISINQASKETLETLPGIGSVTAQHIIAYRTQHGPFKHLDEILNVTNIGPSTYETIRPFIRL